ncbi:hypothetical protein N2152v2_001716 [Parachlorella kessleri]
MEDDLDLFLQLAEEQPAIGQGDDHLQPEQCGAPDDLDTFLQLAEEDGCGDEGREARPHRVEPAPLLSPGSQAPQQQQQQQQDPQVPTKQQSRSLQHSAGPARSARQERLSGWAAAASGALIPGGIPSSRPAGSLPPLLQQQQQPQQAFRITFQQQAQQQRSSHGTGAAGLRPGVFKDTEQGSIIERLSGLKIKNPVVSSAQVKARLADASVVKLAQVKTRHRTAGLEGAWATLCVVGEKSKPRESQSGRTYSIWKVTDLDATSHSLFLFGSAHSDLWKESEGTLIALFSPKVRSEGDFALSVDSPEQLWVLGSAKEFGYCKANKKNGEPCRMPVNAARCPYCPYHVQSEYNRLKPTRRNEFQETNLKTAFRQGLQRGLQWQPGQFVGDGPQAAKARMPLLPQARLETAAESARDKGSSTGSRYLKTVANPAAVAAACQERDVLALRHNKIGPNEAPIPLPRAPHVVIPTGAAATAVARTGSGSRGGGGVMPPLPAKRKAPEDTAGAPAAGSGSVRGAVCSGSSGKQRQDMGRNGALMEVDLFEEDLFEESDARKRAIELVRSMGGAPAPDCSRARRTSVTAEAQHSQAALDDAPELSPPAPGRGSDCAEPSRAAAGTAAAIAGVVDRGGAAAISPLELLGIGNGSSEATPAAAQPARQRQDSCNPLLSAGRGPSLANTTSSRTAPPAAAAAAKIGGLGGMLYNPSAAAAAAQHAGVPAAAATQPSAAAAAVAARGYQHPLGALGPAAHGKKAQAPTNSRVSILGKLGIKEPGGVGNASGSGNKGTQSLQKKQQGPQHKAQHPQAQAQAPRNAFEAAFGSVIAEMEQTAGAQTGSRYQSSVDCEDQERIDKLLAVLEQKDEMAQKMDSVKSLKVQAFRCKVCNYTSERRREECSAHPHAVERVETVKRWWECEHCKYRFSTVGVCYPTKRCAKCQHTQTDFKAVSMYRPFKQYDHEQSAVASREKLLARGTEQKWVTS